MMMTSSLRRAAVASGLALLLLSAGCSSSDSGSDGASRSTTTTAASSDSASTTTGAATPANGPLDRYADYETKSYDDDSHWVCRPDITDDICDGNLDATSIAADGKLSVEPFERAKSPKIDCFYVYPTISRDKTKFSDWEASPDEEGFVTLNQAARLQSECRLYAPVYRQLTLGGLGSAIGGGGGGDDDGTAKGDPFADVLDAFRTYMAEDNDGRGFVLIGHSQGTAMLNQLIAKEIDPNADVRSHLVGAYLAGGAVAVPKGKSVGGDFQEVPLCTSQGEAGCVVTWATFRSTVPPPSGSFFGKPRAKDGEAGCVNPAAVAGGSADLDAYFPADASASILSALGTSTDGKAWLAGDPDQITTPYVKVPGLVSGACASKDGFNYLEATVHPEPSDPRADDIPGDLTPQWGLHLVDVNLTMGNVVTDVHDQATTYLQGS